MSELTGLTALDHGLHFCLVLDFWLVGEDMTQMLDRNLSHINFLVRAPVPLSRDTVLVGKVDELEEDVR